MIATQRQWRAGRKVGRTVYVVVDDTATNDVLIGMMDTPELAAEVVYSHNRVLREIEEPRTPLPEGTDA